MHTPKEKVDLEVFSRFYIIFNNYKNKSMNLKHEKVFASV